MFNIAISLIVTLLNDTEGNFITAILEFLPRKSSTTHETLRHFKDAIDLINSAREFT